MALLLTVATGSDSSDSSPGSATSTPSATAACIRASSVAASLDLHQICTRTIPHFISLCVCLMRLLILQPSLDRLRETILSGRCKRVSFASGGHIVRGAAIEIHTQSSHNICLTFLYPTAYPCLVAVPKWLAVIVSFSTNDPTPLVKFCVSDILFGFALAALFDSQCDSKDQLKYGMVRYPCLFRKSVTCPSSSRQPWSSTRYL
jgi:hypothetical protein